ncbi:MAG TPA: hypothetical protein VNH18_11185 [Bryobacteraceae bacterium]|nr:hypothetical protein [Bryobacteraceae bacterium]
MFLAYSAAYAILQVIQGNRSYFLLPAVLFAIGRLISGDLRKRIWRPIIRLAPLGLVLMWGIVRSEELRVIFERTANSNDTVERLQSLSTGQSSAVDVTDGSGIRMNAIFRVGSRLFELSATDVISRTPSAIPYWGWEDEDWSVLFSALLPLRFNKDAAIWTSERNYCFFLREYGWYIDPFAETGSSGTSMPATLVADSWRRFGWVGVIVWFVFWGWFLRNVTKLLNPSRRSLLMLIFSGALLSDLPNYYTYDIISLVTILPRRCMVLFAFALGMSAIIAMAQSKRADLGGGRMAKRLGIGSAMRQVGA